MYRAVLSVLFILVALAGCGVSAILRDAQADLDEHRALWQSQRPHEYMFEYTPKCFGACTIVPILVAVRDNEVFVAVADKGESHATLNLRTIDKLFEMLQYAIDESADQMDVAYDSVHGYPARGLHRL